MDITTNNIKSLKTIISKTETANYDWDIIVPDFKPDVGRIVSADGIPNIITKDIMQDRAMITGNIKISILYIPYDNPAVLKNVETVQNFNYVMELSGLRQNMGLNILATTDKINVSILNSRKLHLSCFMNFLGNVSSFNELNYISEIASEDIHYKTKEILTYKAICENENVINLVEEIEVPVGNPSIDEILKLDIKINNKNIKSIHDKIVVKGDLEIVTVYNSEIEGDIANYMCHEIPFTEIFDVPGVDENTICDAEFNLRNVTYLLKEDREGEKRIIQLEVSIFIQNKSYEKVKLNSIVDAYSLKHNIKTETENYMFDEIINQINGQFNIKDTINFGTETDIVKIINMSPKSELTKVTTRDNSIILNGNIIIDILYVSKDNSEIKSASSTLAFEQVINCDGATEDIICDLKTDIIKCAYNIVSHNELEIRVNMEYTSVIKRDLSSEIILSISYDEENPLTLNKSGIVVYFCNGKENIWDIAKKYKTTVDEILSINGIDNESEIKSHMKLLIP